jgi:hypothetical protein
MATNPNGDAATGPRNTNGVAPAIPSPRTPNAAMLEALAKVDAILRGTPPPTGGDTLDLLHRARAGAMYGQDAEESANKVTMRPNAELLELAKQYPPPDDWFEKDEAKPF